MKDVFSSAMSSMTLMAWCNSVPATYLLEKNLTSALGVIGMNAMITRPIRFMSGTGEFGT